MSFLQIILLGGLSGLTIFLGMPIARLRIAKKVHLVFLNALSIGVLFFLFVDIITEAFGITGPLANKKSSWGFLAFLGLIGGGPNIIGTIIGYWFTSALLSVFFLAMAAGAIMYVIGELLAMGRKHSSHAWNGWGLTVGFFAAILTDFILVLLGV